MPGRIAGRRAARAPIRHSARRACGQYPPGDAPGLPPGSPAAQPGVMAVSADRWMTYADAASLLGVQVDSLRHRARREHWGKRMGNEGKALVLVPLDTVPPPGEPLGEPAGDAPAPPIPHRPVRRPDGREDDRVATHLARIAELERRVGELGADLAAARGERDRERGERHGERDRADRVTAELADLARQFATTTATAAAEGRAREAALEARIEAVRAEAAALRDRPWWRRLAG